MRTVYFMRGSDASFRAHAACRSRLTVAYGQWDDTPDNTLHVGKRCVDFAATLAFFIWHKTLTRRHLMDSSGIELAY